LLSSTPNSPNFQFWPAVTVRSYGMPQDEAARTNGPLADQDIALSSPVSAGGGFTHAFPPYSLTLFTIVLIDGVLAVTNPMSPGTQQFWRAIWQP